MNKSLRWVDINDSSEFITLDDFSTFIISCRGLIPSKDYILLLFVYFLSHRVGLACWTGPGNFSLTGPHDRPHYRTFSQKKTYWYYIKCIALHCIVSHRIALHCIALHCIALHCIILHCIVLHCIALFHNAAYTWSDQWCINKVIFVIHRRA